MRGLGGERSDVNAPTLIAAPRVCPINEPLHLVAIFPHQAKKLARVQAGGFGPEKSLEPPAQIRTIPRIQAITAGHDPVVPQHLPASLHRASPRYQCSGPVFL